jgi:hypothetical protein
VQLPLTSSVSSSSSSSLDTNTDTGADDRNNVAAAVSPWTTSSSFDMQCVVEDLFDGSTSCYAHVTRALACVGRRRRHPCRRDATSVFTHWTSFRHGLVASALAIAAVPWAFFALRGGSGSGIVHNGMCGGCDLGDAVAIAFRVVAFASAWLLAFLILDLWMRCTHVYLYNAESAVLAARACVTVVGGGNGSNDARVGKAQWLLPPADTSALLRRYFQRRQSCADATSACGCGGGGVDNDAAGEDDDAGGDAAPRTRATATVTATTAPTHLLQFDPCHSVGNLQAWTLRSLMVQVCHLVTGTLIVRRR